MRTHLRSITVATAVAVTAMFFGGAAIAATHHSDRGHERYSEACSTLASQWNDAAGGHHGRHFKSALHQESIGARDCRSHRTAMQRAGTEHYRTALRLLGVKPNA